MRDYHLHTTYSPDGNAQMREQIRAAVDAGLEEICITDHLDLKHHEAIFDVPCPTTGGLPSWRRCAPNFRRCP